MTQIAGPTRLASTYRAPPWLPGGHLQTILASLRPPPGPPLTRERWDTPDGDFIDIDWAGPANAANLLLTFHGLEGSSDSHYMRALAAHALAEGWRCALVHFRGCSGEMNRRPRAYHSGDSDEIDWIVRRMHALDPARRIHIAAVSLGGNAVLKWLGEREGEAARLVQRAVAVSAPFDLAAAGRALERGFNVVYTQRFLVTMKVRSAAQLSRFPGLFNEKAMMDARTLYEFDNVVTAPVHGFRDTEDYWSRSSSFKVFGGIQVPTLLLNARNDPFMPEVALGEAHGASAQMVLEFPAQGGHVGFLSGPFPGQHAWLPRRIFEFFRS